VHAPLEFRAATAADAPRLAAVMAAGIETYRSFAGEGFRPPGADEIAADLAARLPLPSVWCELAEAGGEVAGYVSLLPAAESRLRDDTPGVAHFWMLFVRVPWWGTGLAGRLHAAACDAAVARGFTSMRLFTPAGQARARAFYERRGWAFSDGPFPHEAMQLEIVEYRRALPAAVSA
jgi:GNAT superfamily N-acetyltransferase